MSGRRWRTATESKTHAGWDLRDANRIPLPLPLPLALALALAQLAATKQALAECGHRPCPTTTVG